MIGRVVVVNADDFGCSHGINHGINEAHEHGIVTSASLMVLWPAAPDAAAYARGHPELSVGLHVDLGEWVWRDGTWPAVYELVDLTERSTSIRSSRTAETSTVGTLVASPAAFDHGFPSNLDASAFA